VHDSSKSLQVLEIHCADNDGNPCDRFDMYDPIKLFIKYCCNKPIPGSVILLSIYRNGVELIHTFDTDFYPDRLTNRQMGEFVEEIELPNRLLKSGMITISVSTAVVNKNWIIESYDNVITFFIEELSEDTSYKGYSTMRTGILMATPKWKLSSIN
jgi:lipopolysaccharide transport system ATP-binding protein